MFVKSLAKLVLILALAGGVAALALRLPPDFKINWPVAAAPAAKAPRDLPVPVALGAAAIADVPVFADGVGTVKALNTVTVRPQIDGKITDITFTEGAEVKKGDLLAKLDPVSVKALLDQVKAKKATDEAQLANTSRDLDRFIKVGTLGVTQQQIDTQRALVAQQKAGLQADQAAVANAEAQLAYASVTSPINGVTGIRQVDVGNIVRNQTDPIVVVAQVQPISVFFTLPQQQLGDVTRGMATGALTADALTTDGGKVLDSGTLKVIDNQVDPSTGTIKLKAEFPNSARQLWPGQFVSVRLKVDTLKGVTVAPVAAIQQGPSGAFVYVAGDDDTVSVRPVTTGQADGERTVITAGLKPGEKIVTAGFSRLKDGAKISAGPSKGGKSAPAPDAGAAKPAAPSADNAGSSGGLVSPAAAAESGPGNDPAKKDGKPHRHRKTGANEGDAGANPPAASP